MSALTLLFATNMDLLSKRSMGCTPNNAHVGIRSRPRVLRTVRFLTLSTSCNIFRRSGTGISATGRYGRPCPATECWSGYFLLKRRRELPPLLLPALLWLLLMFFFCSLPFPPLLTEGFSSDFVYHNDGCFRCFTFHKKSVCVSQPVCVGCFEFGAVVHEHPFVRISQLPTEHGMVKFGEHIEVVCPHSP